MFSSPRLHPALLGAVSLLALSGCMVGPNFVPPRPAIPTSYTQGTSASSYVSGGAVNPQWWNSFNDPELTRLENTAVSQNLDLQIATQRMLEAEAQAQIEGAVLYPNIGFNASYSREGLSDKGVVQALGGGGGAGIPVSGIPPFDVYQYGLQASYDLDLWGKNRRTAEAAVAAAAGSVEARRAALLNVETQVASNYIQLRGTQSVLAITQKNLDSANQLVALTVERQQAGLTTALDVANARATAAQIASQIPTLTAERDALINQLGLLLGQTPSAFPPELLAAAPVPLTPPSVPIGLPAGLLRRRPDVREAEDKLHSATAEVGVAVAQFFPDFSLTGSVALQALQLKNLNELSALTYAVGPTLSLPLFEGGQLHGQLKLRKAQQKEAAIGYAKTVLTAFYQVDNALSAYTNEHATLTALTQDTQQSQIALSLAEEQYKQGLVDYLTVLTAQQAYLTAQQTQALALETLGTDLVTLYQSLGGGWQDAPGSTGG